MLTYRLDNDSRSFPLRDFLCAEGHRRLAWTFHATRGRPILSRKAAPERWARREVLEVLPPRHSEDSQNYFEGPFGWSLACDPRTVVASHRNQVWIRRLALLSHLHLVPPLHPLPLPFLLRRFPHLLHLPTIGPANLLKHSIPPYVAIWCWSVFVLANWVTLERKLPGVQAALSNRGKSSFLCTASAFSSLSSVAFLMIPLRYRVNPTAWCVGWAIP